MPSPARYYCYYYHHHHHHQLPSHPSPQVVKLSAQLLSFQSKEQNGALVAFPGSPNNTTGGGNNGATSWLMQKIADASPHHDDLVDHLEPLDTGIPDDEFLLVLDEKAELEMQVQEQNKERMHLEMQLRQRSKEKALLEVELNSQGTEVGDLVFALEASNTENKYLHEEISRLKRSGSTEDAAALGARDRMKLEVRDALSSYGDVRRRNEEHAMMQNQLKRQMQEGQADPETLLKMLGANMGYWMLGQRDLNLSAMPLNGDEAISAEALRQTMVTAEQTQVSCGWCFVVLLPSCPSPTP